MRARCPVPHLAGLLFVSISVASCMDPPLAITDPDPLATVALANTDRPLTPLHGHMVGSLVRTRTSPTELIYRLDNTAVGPISHLGIARASWAIPAVLFDPLNRELVVQNAQWSGTLTAANGDQIIGRYTFRDPTVSFSVIGDFVATLDLLVVGGTGRFAHATGQAVTVVRGNVFTEAYTLTLSGEAILTAKD